MESREEKLEKVSLILEVFCSLEDALPWGKREPWGTKKRVPDPKDERVRETLRARVAEFEEKWYPKALAANRDAYLWLGEGAITLSVDLRDEAGEPRLMVFHSHCFASRPHGASPHSTWQRLAAKCETLGLDRTWFKDHVEFVSW